jgi:prolyl oligopeptidase
MVTKVKDEIFVYNFTERVMQRLAEDFVGAANLNGHREDPAFYVSMTGFNTPGTVAKYDFTEKDEGRRWSVVKTTMVKGLQPDDFEARQVGGSTVLVVL